MSSNIRSIQLPCDGEGVCMRCNLKPAEVEKLTCITCNSAWHLNCLTSGSPERMEDAAQWNCPDCSDIVEDNLTVEPALANNNMLSAIRAIQSDNSLNEEEKAKKRQEILSRNAGAQDGNGEEEETENENKRKIEEEQDSDLTCPFCLDWLDKPITVPCGHSFCSRCFRKWTGSGKYECVKCRRQIPPKVVGGISINSAMVAAVEEAKMSNILEKKSKTTSQIQDNQDRPDAPFLSNRAQKKGMANASSGKILVNIPQDYFGPILPEHDIERRIGVKVGSTWNSRLECRQWGVHWPHISGAAGQKDYGAQSVVISGAYKEDEDHGEWFLYTGSGGKDLVGNQRTSKVISSNQDYERTNEALRISCLKGYPIRVVRSNKKKDSPYAPTEGLRYDGLYRVEKCWKKISSQGIEVCRFLFVRCDNEPAPWTSNGVGDRPRCLPIVEELNQAKETMERSESPAWDFDEADGTWKWVKPPPKSKMQRDDREKPKKRCKKAKEFPKEFDCLICLKVLNLPMTTPCGHNFCKACLEAKFAGTTLARERNASGRTLRSQKNVMKCPKCQKDIADVWQKLQVNRGLFSVIEALKKRKLKERCTI